MPTPGHICPAAVSWGQNLGACESQRWCANFWPVKMYSSQLQQGEIVGGSGWGVGVGTQLLKHVVE